MLIAKDVKSLERKLKALNIPYKRIIETETYYWIESEKHGYLKALKPRTKEEIEEILKQGAFPPKYIRSVLYGERIKTEALNKVLKVKKKGIIQEGKAGVGKTYALIFKIAIMLRYYHLNAPLYIPLQALTFRVTEPFIRNMTVIYLTTSILTSPSGNLTLSEKLSIMLTITIKGSL